MKRSHRIFIDACFQRRLWRVAVCACLLPGVLAVTASSVCADSFPHFNVVFPVMGARVSSKFGMRNHPVYKTQRRHHAGVDLAVPSHSHVRSIAGGVVVFAGWYKGYGKLVTVQHEGGFVSLYGHLDEILVNVGEQIASGAVIGRVGKTGTATGSHLHFEWRKNGKPLDPLKAFPELAAPAEG